MTDLQSLRIALDKVRLAYGERGADYLSELLFPCAEALYYIARGPGRDDIDTYIATKALEDLMNKLKEE